MSRPPPPPPRPDATLPDDGQRGNNKWFENTQRVRTAARRCRTIITFIVHGRTARNRQPYIHANVIIMIILIIVCRRDYTHTHTSLGRRHRSNGRSFCHSFFTVFLSVTARWEICPRRKIRKKKPP